jgi:phage shock protein PspC (stress-responsive transcriptional regulator)
MESNNEIQTPLRSILKNSNIDYTFIKQRLMIVFIILVTIVIIAFIIAWMH